MTYQIFISYRRDDSGPIAQQIHEQLRDNFGSLSVFFDQGDSIPPGDDFRGVISKAISTCKIMLVIISSKWLTVTDQLTHERRIDSNDDIVNYEIFEALTRKLHVIPVLVDGTTMPPMDDLPKRLRDLCACQASFIRHDTVEENISSLVQFIEHYLYGDIPHQVKAHLSSFQNQITDRLEGFSKHLNAFQGSFDSVVALGLHLVNKERKGFDAYYQWITSEPATLELFCAGRSVLHRIEADVTTRTQNFAEGPLKIENIIAAKLEKGAKIRILFLDPTWDLVERFAGDEHQSYDDMLRDIAKSVGISKRLNDRLTKNVGEGGRFPLSTHLEIRICREIPYYAYHQHNSKVIIGFYFIERTGTKSAAFEVRDDDTQRMFSDHFDTIFKRPNSDEQEKHSNRFLIKIPRTNGKLEFNSELYDELYKFFQGKLSTVDIAELLPPP